MQNNVLFALLLTVFAGISTVIGSFIAIFAKRTDTKFLAFSLGFSAGVMVYVSMVEIFSKSKHYLIYFTNELAGNIIAVISFFVGIVFIALIDFLIPSVESDMGNIPSNKNKKLKRMGVMTALAIGIHNFPEGLATFTSALKDPHLGIAIAIAIAIHNIPEGISTSIPIYYSTGNKMQAFWISFLSGITEPIGAIIGYVLLKSIFNDMVFGILFGFVAGIMVFISIEELLPMAREYEKSRATIIGFISGMLVIATSLILFM